MEQLSLFEDRSAICHVHGCDRPKRGENFCHAHYMRWRASGDPGAAEIRPYGRASCLVDGCERAHRLKGFCELHFRRVENHGHPHRILRDHDHLTYEAMHQRLRTLWGSASQYQCIRCGLPAREWAYDGCDPSQVLGPTKYSAGNSVSFYSQWPEFYMPMCVKCHRRLDAAQRLQELTGKKFANLTAYRLSNQR